MKSITAGLAGLLLLALAPAAAHAATVTMQCAPSQVITTTYPSGSTYTADTDGIVTAVNGNDVQAMQMAGCMMVGQSGYTLIGRIVNANMNVTTDQAATMFIPANAYYIPAQMVVKDCTASLTAAQGAVYDAASKGGNTLFGSTTQVMTGCTGAGTAQPVAVTTAGGKVVDAQSAPPILSLTTAQGAAAKANVYFYGYVLGQ